MTMNEVRKLNQEYEERFNKGLEDNFTMDMCIVTRELIHYDPMRDTEADKLTWGEFTRYFDSAMKELERLILIDDRSNYC